MFRIVKATAVAIAVFSMVSSGYADEGHGKQDAEGGAHKGMMMSGDKGQMPDMCRKMMQERETMMKDLTKMDEALEARLADAKKAKGEGKVEALTEVVVALVARQKTMRSTMMAGMSQTMGHMMVHFQKGGMGGDGMGMADCPMMGTKSAGDTESDASEHSEHH